MTTKNLVLNLLEWGFQALESWAHRRKLALYYARTGIVPSELLSMKDPTSHAPARTKQAFNDIAAATQWPVKEEPLTYRNVLYKAAKHPESAFKEPFVNDQTSNNPTVNVGIDPAALGADRSVIYLSGMEMALAAARITKKGLAAADMEHTRRNGGTTTARTSAGCTDDEIEDFRAMVKDLQAGD